ncbi:hypothetical protein Tsubulata_033109 [Turnera subulata]|uniref:CCHC-type domain-containing protein n=1 Tax=Turnera subulata TaxID=218843 RepID=A0A9Q0FCB3_9ROSI|nr:hypothetical protein Tsubulata_033109 [Turnera subulata]
MSSPPQAGLGHGQPASPHPLPSPSFPLGLPASLPTLKPPMPTPQEVDMIPSEQPTAAPPPSFKDKLVARASPSSSLEEEFEEQEDDIVAFHTPEGPVVKLSDRYRSMLHKRWANTLIVKLWGRNIGFRALCNKLPNLWKLKENVRVVDLERNFYFVRFSNRQDYLHALTDGPWIVFDHYLTVEPWIPQFNPANHIIKSVVAWVQIPELSCEYYDRRLLHTVCNMLGRLVRIDHNTAEAIRGRYARVALELNLEKPLQSQVFVDNKWFHIAYENIPQICFSCGHAGHILADCPEQVTRNTIISAQAAEPSSTPALVGPTVGASGLGRQPRGEWMVAAPRQRRPPRNTQAPLGKEPSTGKESVRSKGVIIGQTSGSRFDVLTDYITVDRPSPLVMAQINAPVLEKSKGNNNGKEILRPQSGLVILDNIPPSKIISSPPSSSIPLTINATTRQPPASPQSHTPAESSLKPMDVAPSPSDLSSRTLPTKNTPIDLTFNPSSSSLSNPKPMQEYTTSLKVKNPRVHRKTKRTVPYERGLVSANTMSPATLPSPSSASPIALPDQVSSQEQTFTSLLEKISLNPTKSNSMDTSFDTQGLGHKEKMDRMLCPSKDNKLPETDLMEVTVLPELFTDKSGIVEDPYPVEPQASMEHSVVRGTNPLVPDP